MPPARPLPEIRLTFDEAAVLLALLELLPDDADAPELAVLRDRWRVRLRERMADSVSDAPLPPG